MNTKPGLDPRSLGPDTDEVTLHDRIGRVLMNRIRPQWEEDMNYRGRMAHYLSLEYLVGKVIDNILINTGCPEDIRALLQERRREGHLFETINDAALGNGGLGRLAACFLESAATHNIALNGYGIRYRYGLFRQEFSRGRQVELPDDWLAQGDPFSVRRDDLKKVVRFGNDEAVTAVPYDLPVPGYGCKRIGLLRLWQAEGKFREISDYLYPDDGTAEGKALRLRQEYFFTAATLQNVIDDFTAGSGRDLSKFSELNIFQLNDTHPVVAILEFIRILTEEHDFPFRDALHMARKCFAYTNHTVMGEALERWNLKLFDRLLPQLTGIAGKIERLARSEYRKKMPAGEVEKVRIIAGGHIHMANLALYVCDRVNGVARIHTELLKNDLFSAFHRLYPDKISNKTNGISQRCWLLLANPGLAGLITGLIGSGWITDLGEVGKLAAYMEDDHVLTRLHEIKQRNKALLSDYIRTREGIVLDPSFIFDLQIKRIHEYKRQLMNALSLLYIYYGIKDGSIRDFQPMAFIFGGKAAAGYYRAKAIIKFIHEIAEMINSDSACRDLLKVVFVTNYNVSYAEKLIPAADISEQISLAGTEASGTGNMKFMLNGAVTLGTFDGANIEICNLAGQENNYLFGLKEEEVGKARKVYDSVHFLDSRPDIKRVVQTLIDGTFAGKEELENIYRALTGEGDQYLVLLELDSHVEARLKANKDHANRRSFTQKALSNISSAGYFSSDRTIREYAGDIWRLERA